MQNHLEISSTTQFWTRNVWNLSKSLTESLRKVYVIFQDLSRRIHKGPYGPIYGPINGPIWAPTRTGPLWYTAMVSVIFAFCMTADIHVIFFCKPFNGDNDRSLSTPLPFPGEWAWPTSQERCYWLIYIQISPRFLGRNEGIVAFITYPPPLFKKFHSAPRVSNFLILQGVARVSENFLIIHVIVAPLEKWELRTKRIATT